ncbi:hypothetical protein CIN_03910 [Commensalibacter intestini A911]|uniref:SPOR domain-containing protein n=2 Tax=Commensalibacter intestini TaxID=479936 RepID=A0A251ZU29_9PROT|nr:SPOR domain-containing protein [Commensalibacter intestini]EHD14459.1 hypothetical protein CIN_03910 [Commensalibacter intestini A911]OUI78155.1 hypothetical protein HK18_08870 [Commensalibacter intestini]
MVFINKSLTAYPLSLIRLLPLALLLCVTACGGKKDDYASKPVTIAPSEREIPSSNPNEPPIIILSPTSGDAGYTPASATISRHTKKKVISAPAAPSYTPQTSSASGKNYGVQIGAFSSSALANRAASQARQGASQLSSAKTQIDTISKSDKTLYRVKLTGVSENTAAQACSELTHKQIPCIVTR